MYMFLYSNLVYFFIYNICRDEGPRKVYWAVGLVQGHLAIRGRLDLNKDIQISKLWKDFSHKGLGK